MPEFADIHEILQKLERNDGYFPRAAVAAAISRRDEIVPELLRILERTAENVETLAADVHYMAPTYAMYLLAQFQEPRAYPLLIKLFSTPGEAVMDLAGDVVTEDLGNILASVSSGDMSGMAALVENPEANEYVRSAALKGMVALVATGQKTRQEVMDYFASLFRGRLERKPDYVWTSLVSRCVDLYPGEVYADIQQAYADDLIEGFVIRWEGVEEAYAMGREAALEDLVNSLPSDHRHSRRVVAVGLFQQGAEEVDLEPGETRQITAGAAARTRNRSKGRAERTMPVRQRQEVQEMLRRGLIFSTGGASRFSRHERAPGQRAGAGQNSAPNACRSASTGG